MRRATKSPKKTKPVIQLLRSPVFYSIKWFERKCFKKPRSQTQLGKEVTQFSKLLVKRLLRWGDRSVPGEVNHVMEARIDKPEIM